VLTPGVRLTRRRLLMRVSLMLAAACGLTVLTSRLPPALAARESDARAQARRATGDALLITCARGRHLAVVDGTTGMPLDQIDAGAAPHGLALHADGRAFVATAEGVAVLDVAGRRRLALTPYSVDVGPPRTGEYRPGGMGIALTPDGGRLAVGIYRSGAASLVDIIDTATLAIIGSVAVGLRPFDVVAALDSRHVYSIDHDGYSVTVVDTDTGGARAVPAMPIGRGAFDKPHYAARRSDGALLLPYQGRMLQILDPLTGAEQTVPLSAQTHQHGIALTPDERYALIVGTGPAGSVSGGPSLTILDLHTGAEEIVPLTKPHERIVVSPDGARAYLTGGYLLTGGWDGLTVVDLATRATHEILVPGGPLDIAMLPTAPVT